ncbi:related to cytokinesis inhibitor byr4 [Fusarium oxysporum]|uniref:Related to cytokinesis inhibitor byr4 n=2 Tax=Fusarium oxysporum TaxID=5507 RepID=A0A2H3SZY2_FUSOX|nr:Protein byr4 [Fusarium oxysporum f. sp. cubense]SCO81967.1 related to cytokinesis inhibitor byr4 [Fusarium oxysporum]
MEPLRLKPRQPVEADIENWDDDDFVVEGDDLSFRSPSTATNNPSRPSSSRRRDSGSSHFSFRSELEGEEEQHVHIPGDDEKSTLDAIAAAQSAGIPLPSNVPSSALMGGTIKRLGGRKIRKIIQDDWENDLEIPDSSQGLKMKKLEQPKSPEASRHVSFGSTHTSPMSWGNSPPTSPFDKVNRRESTQSIQSIQSMQSIQSATSSLSAAINLDRFKDADDDDDFFGDGGDTIRASKNRQLPKPVSFITPPTPQREAKPSNPEDDFEMDLELPSDGKLKLSTRKEIPKTPSNQSEDLDWGEGSLGTRYGGTRRDARSARSSAASALSPSVSSSITAESEDETFDGLVLPPGPVNWTERLQQRRKSRSPNRISEEPIVPAKKIPAAEADKPDFLDGLDLGEGDVFDSSKLTLHKNVRVKETRPASPARPKAAVSLTFTHKPLNSTRIPRLNHHERTHSTSLEPVSESGGPIPQRTRRSHSRLGHSSQSSIVSLPTPTTTSPSHGLPPTPRRREVNLRTSTNSLRTEPTTTSAQLLKQKRSLPAIRGLNTPAKQPSYRHERPPSRSENNRPSSGVRPKTPTERQRHGATDSPATVRKSHLPFLPAGASQSQSQHVATKQTRGFRRHDSDNSISSIDLRPNSRTLSRSTMRSPSPNHRHRVTADTWERLSKPKNKKNFGDGHELDGFDDLPTSKETETKYLKQPTSSGPKVALRNKLYQNVLPDRNTTTSPSIPPTPRPSFTPHFARDTAASRIARETALAQRVPSSGPLTPLNSQRVAHLSSRGNLTPTIPQSNIRSRKHKRPQQTKPHLISNLNSGKESKMVNGMFYNADTYKWEGNENALNVFEPPVQTPTQAVVSSNTREKETSTPRPALITNISATKGVQVVGGMVFDPQNMCWLKLDNPAKPTSETSDTMDGFDALDDEDVFKDIPDLEDNAADDEGAQGRVSDIKDEWLVGEEFDVGPEFIRRQREEEDRWRKKCEKWIGRGSRDREAWRWTIRELVSQFDDLAM